MSLAAKQIREDIATRLKAKDDQGHYKTAAQDRIFPSRMLPIQPHETLPVLVINTPNETGNTKSHTNSIPQFDQTVTIRIEGTVSAADDKAVEDALDALDEQIRETLLRDPEWVKQFDGGIDRLETVKGLDAEGEKRFGLVIVTMTVKTHLTFEPILDDALTKIHLKVDAGPTGPDEKIDATAVIPLTT